MSIVDHIIYVSTSPVAQILSTLLGFTLSSHHN